jgi:hypothetical protein
VLSVAPGDDPAAAGPSCPAAAAAAAAAPAALPVGAARAPAGAWPPGYDAEEGAWCPGAEPAAEPAAAAAALPVAWHSTRPLLAAADAAGGVQLFDYEGRVPLLGASHGGGAGAGAPLAPRAALRHPLQRRVAALAWRPAGAPALAAGGAGGVALWRLGRALAPGGAPAAATAALDWLPAPGCAAVAALAWHPGGHLLAGALAGRGGLVLWDVASGAATRVRAGGEPAALLAWSPRGEYLLEGGAGGGARLWEAGAWRSARWAPPPGGGPLVAGAWAPDGRALLLAHAAGVAALHLTAEAPSLAAQVLPLALPELAAGPCSGGGAPPRVAAAAWDARGQRLAVALAGGGAAADGALALYDTRRDPILTARLVGLARLGGARSGDPAAAPAAAEELGWEVVDAGEAGGARSAEAAARGAAAPPAWVLAFMPAFAQGAALAARHGDAVAVLPMYFSS